MSNTTVMRISKRNYEIIAQAGNASDTLDDALTKLLDHYVTIQQEECKK